LCQQDPIWGQLGRVGVRRRPRGRVAGAPLLALGRTAVRRPYQQDEVTMLMRGQRRRRSGRPGSKARGSSGGAPEVGEDDAEEEDGEEADARGMGIRSPGGRGRSGRKPPTFWGPTTADRRHGGGRGRRWVGGRRISGGRRWRRIPCARGWGRRGRRRSGRMTAAAAEEDTTTTMAADRGRKSG
jgi:hypothetical protein